MTIDLPRRRLLSLRPTKELPIRPPWSVEEPLFIARCQRCNACVESCPTQLLKQGDGGYPEAFFNGAECTFCEVCVNVCFYSALLRESNSTPWQITANVTDQCLTKQHIDCRLCADACEPEAIHFQLVAKTVAQVRIDSSFCSGCGACVSYCPVAAITMLYPKDNQSA